MASKAVHLGPIELLMPVPWKRSIKQKAPMRRIYSLVKPIKYDSDPLDVYKKLLFSLLEEELAHGKSKKFVGNEVATIVATLAAHCVLSKRGKLQLSKVSSDLLSELGDESTKKEEDIKNRLELRLRVKAFQDYFALRIVSLPKASASASEAIPITDENDDQKLRNICSIVDNYALLSARPSKPLISIGAGRLLVRSFIPEVVRRYREKNPKESFDVTIESGLPQHLRSDETKGRYDVVVTSFERDTDVGGRIHEALLPMHLLFDRRVSIPSFQSADVPESVVSELLSNRMVVAPDPIRSPSLAFAMKYIPDNSRYVTTEVWTEAMGITLSGGNACCAAYPQIFTDEERSQFRSIVLPEEVGTKLRLGALKPVDSKHNRSKDHVRIAEGIWNEFGLAIRELSEMEAPPVPKAMSHVAHMTQFNGKMKWLHGDLKDIVITPRGYFRGTHVFKSPTADAKVCHFEFFGRLTSDAEEKNSNLAWSGMQENVLQRKSEDMHASETYSVAITAPSSALDKLAIGMWCGRATWTEEKRPHFGHFVIYAGKKKSDREITDELNKYYDEHPELELKIDRHRK